MISTGLPAGVRCHVPLAEYSTIRIGGEARYLARAETETELVEIQRFARREGLPVTLVGRGSNMLFADDGLSGLVLLLGEEFARIEKIGDRVLRAGARVDNNQLVRFARQQALSGVEFLVGIPGTLGGAVAMNAGAHGNEIGPRVVSVSLLDEAGEVITLTREQLSFGYREVRGLDRGVVLSVDLELTPDDPGHIAERMQAHKDYRRRTQPLEWPSLGSVFKRVPGHFPGKLIEDAGCKGMRIGGIEVSRRHANFFINVGNGRSLEFLELVEQVRERVREHAGVELPLEVIVNGVDV